jgi:hypothetical protein
LYFGNQFLAFSARSTEKINDDTYVDTWIDFIKFPPKGEELEIPDWLKAKSKVKVTGDLQIRSYNDKLRFSCRVREYTLYIPPQK